MLEEIRIHGLGVIDDAVLELDPGFTVVTGETGAGKTMVVTGLSLLLGTRADAGLVRPGTDRAVVEGRLRVGATSAAARRAVDAGARMDGDALIVLRSLSAEGRSRAYAGGAGVPIGLLGDLAEELVALHGQSEQLQLLRPSRQRQVLDAYAGAPVLEPLARYRAGYERLLALHSELEDLVNRAREREQETDLLRFGLAEIEAVDPSEEEPDALAREEDRLFHADTLRSAGEQARRALAGDEDAVETAADALTLVAGARRQLDGVRDHDPTLAALAERLAEASFLLTDVAADLASYVAAVETDPARLQAVGERRAALSTLTRKYGDTVADVLAWAESAAQRLAALEGSDERIGELRRERRELDAELGKLAEQVSLARTDAAERFGAAVTRELAALAMPHAQLSVRVGQSEVADDATPAAALMVAGRRVAFGPHGIDDVELCLRPHAGAAARPVQRGASGGELSRVMLAVEVVFAGADKVPTFVFDEVDAGVGGQAAVEIGRRLAKLARRAQVIVVTHLPQVAAYADRHYVVHKSDDGTVTRSGLTRLDASQRVDELARMLAGLADSDSARAHAEELLARAAADVATGDAHDDPDSGPDSDPDSDAEGGKRRRPRSTGATRSTAGRKRSAAR